MKKGVLFNIHRSLRMMSFFVFGLFFSAFFTSSAQAFYKDVPLRFLDGGGNPITTQVDVRLSLWGVPDLRSGDVDGSGNINTSAAHYGGYQTEITITPGSSGFYTLYTGNVSGFPEFPDQDAYLLQVEFKGDTDPNTSYQLLRVDEDPKWDTTDRYLIPGLTAYSVPDAGPRTYSETFTLDSDSDATTAVTLVFGETLAKTLKFHLSNSRFELNDDLAITGGLSATAAVDFSGASSFKNVVVSSDPGTCSEGEQFYNSTDDQLKVCTASNTWSVLNAKKDVNTLYINRTSNSTGFVIIGEFIYGGTDLEGAITDMNATIFIDAGATNYYTRVYDLTNGKVIAEVSGTNNTQQIVNYGTISNLPSGQALFQIQQRRVGGLTQMIRMGSFQYIH